MQLEQICPNMHSIEFRRKIPNIEMLTPKALGPTLQLPLLHGINCRNSKTLVPFTASAAAFRSTNPYARCYSRSAISGGSPSGGLTGTRLGVLYSAIRRVRSIRRVCAILPGLEPGRWPYPNRRTFAFIASQSEPPLALALIMRSISDSAMGG